MSISNACGTGHCTAMVSAAAIRVCRDTEYDDWNGLCPYQSGNKVTSEQEAAGVVVLDCCGGGCKMNVHDYARWNSLCAYTSDPYTAVKGVRPDGLITDESESVAEITIDVIQSLAAKLDKSLDCCTVKLLSGRYHHQLKIYSVDGNRLITATAPTVEQMEELLNHLLSISGFLNTLLGSLAHYVSQYGSTAVSEVVPDEEPDRCTVCGDSGGCSFCTGRGCIFCDGTGLCTACNPNLCVD